MTQNQLILFMLLLFYVGIGLFGSIIILSAVPKFSPLITMMINFLKIICITLILCCAITVYNIQNNIKR